MSSLLIALFSYPAAGGQGGAGVAWLWTLLCTAGAGIFLAADWITFLLAWETAAWTSAALAMRSRERSPAREKAHFALSLTASCLIMAAIFLLADSSDSLAMAESVALLAGQWAAQPGLTGVILLLFSLGFLLQAALGALPAAERDTDSSALLRTVPVACGVYGLAVTLIPAFSGPGAPSFYGDGLGWLGALAALCASVLALFQADIRRVLALNTVQTLGIILLGLSSRSAAGAAGALFQALNHTLFKTDLSLSLAAFASSGGEGRAPSAGGRPCFSPAAVALLAGGAAAAALPPSGAFVSMLLILSSLAFKGSWVLAAAVLISWALNLLSLVLTLPLPLPLGPLCWGGGKGYAAASWRKTALILLAVSIAAAGIFPQLALVPLQAALGALGGKDPGSLQSGVFWWVGGAFLSYGALGLALLLGRRRRAGAEEGVAGGAAFLLEVKRAAALVLEKVSLRRWSQPLARSLASRYARGKRLLARPPWGRLALAAFLVLILWLGLMRW